MKKTELRIGNLVKINNNECKVIDITLFEDVYFIRNSRYSAIKLSAIKPISLTEEWAKSNSVSSHITRNIRIYEFIDNKCSYTLYLRFDEGKAYWIANTYMQVDLPYVHLWQNLYFSLTGEELKIK